MSNIADTTTASQYTAPTSKPTPRSGTKDDKTAMAQGGTAASADTDTPAKRRLSRPFRSPFLSREAVVASSSSSSPSQDAAASSSSPRKRATLRQARSERHELEARLLTLQQADLYLRNGSLRTLPDLIRKWRQAGQSAAQDLWRLTGADSADSSCSLAALSTSKGDYGLESQPYSQQDDSQDRKRKYRESTSPMPHGPMLRHCPRRMSAGEEELASGLLDQSDDLHVGTTSDAGGSQTSLPDVAELLRRSQSLRRSSHTTTTTLTTTPSSQSVSEKWPSRERETVNSTAQSNGPNRSWNVGSMLDVLGADKAVLGWNAEDEEFLTQ